MGDLAVRQPHLGQESIAALARIVASDVTGMPQDDIAPYLLVRLLRCGYIRRQDADSPVFVATPTGIARARHEEVVARRREEEHQRREIIRGRVQAMVERMIDDAPAPAPIPSLRDLPGYRERNLLPLRQAQPPAVAQRRIPPPDSAARPAEYRALPAMEDAMQAIRDSEQRMRQELETYAAPGLPSASSEALPVVHVGHLPARGSGDALAAIPTAAILPTPDSGGPVLDVLPPGGPVPYQDKASGGKAWRTGAVVVAVAGGALLIAGTLQSRHASSGIAGASSPAAAPSDVAAAARSPRQQIAAVPLAADASAAARPQSGMPSATPASPPAPVRQAAGAPQPQHRAVPSAPGPRVAATQPFAPPVPHGHAAAASSHSQPAMVAAARSPAAPATPQPHHVAAAPEGGQLVAASASLAAAVAAPISAAHAPPPAAVAAAAPSLHAAQTAAPASAKLQPAAGPSATADAAADTVAQPVQRRTPPTPVVAAMPRAAPTVPPTHRAAPRPVPAAELAAALAVPPPVQPAPDLPMLVAQVSPASVSNTASGEATMAARAPAPDAGNTAAASPAPMPAADRAAAVPNTPTPVINKAADLSNTPTPVTDEAAETSHMSTPATDQAAAAPHSPAPNAAARAEASRQPEPAAARSVARLDHSPREAGNLSVVLTRLRDGEYSDHAAVDMLNLLSLRAARAGRAFSPISGMRDAVAAHAKPAPQSAEADAAAFGP